MRARSILALLGSLAALLVAAGLARAATPAPPPIGTPAPVTGASALSGIACASATTCEAVGATDSGAAAVVTITGGTPSRAVAVPSVPSADTLTLAAIACPATTTCEAVGSLLDSSGDQSAVVVPIIRGTPSAPRVAADSEASQGDAPSLTGIACPSAASCEAVGEGIDALATQITDGSPSPLVHDQDPAIGELTGIVCAGATCDALGSGSDGRGVAVPVSPGGLGAVHELAGTAALTTGGCVPEGPCEVLATGADGDSRLVSDAGGSFGTPVTLHPDELTGIACETAAECVATGATEAGGGVLVPIAHGTPGTPVPAPFGSAGQVACASATTCLVAGTTDDGGAAITEVGPGVDAVSLNVGGAEVRGTTVGLGLDCQLACAGTIAETATAGARGHAHRVTIGRASFSLPAGAGRTVAVRLDAAGRALLRREHVLDVQLAVSTRTSGHASLVAIRSAVLGRARRGSGHG